MSRTTNAPSLRCRRPRRSTPPSPTARCLPSGEKAQHRAIVSRIQDRTGRLASQSQMTTALSSPHVAMCDCDGCGARPQSRRSAWPAATGWPSCKARPSVAAASKISPPAVVTAKRSLAASQQTASTHGSRAPSAAASILEPASRPSAVAVQSWM